MAPVVTEVIEVGEGSRVFTSEVAQPHLALVKEARVVVKATVVCNFGISVAQLTKVEFVQVAVPPVESRLDRQMEFAQVPRGWHDKPSPGDFQSRYGAKRQSQSQTQDIL